MSTDAATPPRPESARTRDRQASPGAADATARWFVALRPAPAARRRLQHEAARIAALRGGRIVPAERIHMTLVFIGDAARSREGAMRELVDTLPRPQALRLERVGSFDGRLLWLAPSAPPAWLDQLSAAARDGLDRLGVAFDRKRFAAHVTLVRDARPTRGEALDTLAAGLAPIDLGTSTLHLVESFTDRAGLHYRFA